MKAFLTAILLAFSAYSYAQQQHIAELSGVPDIEDLDETVMERFEFYSTHPLKINSASRSKLSASGLFTDYQITALLKERERSGDILSYTELESIGGFGKETVDALKPFISLASVAAPGHQSTDRQFNGDVILSGRMKTEQNKGTGWTFAGKLRFESEGRWSVAAAWRDRLSACASGRLGRTTILAGDFNARFGQGLVLWSGFSLSGVASPAAVMRRGSGSAPAWTFSPQSALRGISACREWSRSSLSVMAAERNGTILPAANYTYYGQRRQLGMTLTGKAVSTDFRRSLGHTDLFGELAYEYGGNGFTLPCTMEKGISGNKGSAAAVAGAVMNIAYDIKVSALARWYPSDYTGAFAGAVRSASKVNDETGVTIGTQIHRFSLTADGAYHPSKHTHRFKATASQTFKFGERWSLVARTSERYKPSDPLPCRTDIRTDLKRESGPWVLQWRANALFCRDMAWLTYIEAGYRKDLAGIYGRATAFNVRNWDDRIYSYERDVPGSFNVPAYYGKGYALSLTGSYRKMLYLHAYLLVSDRTVKTEVKLQFHYDLFHLYSSGAFHKHSRS